MIIIDVKGFAAAKGLKMKHIQEELNVSNVSINGWRKEAPDVVKGIFLAIKDNPRVDVLKVFVEWPKPPHVIGFIRDCMVKYNCSFTDLVKDSKEV